jgi:hypothetical protein
MRMAELTGAMARPAGARASAALRWRRRLDCVAAGAVGVLLGDAVAFASVMRAGVGQHGTAVTSPVVRPAEQPGEATYPLQPTPDGGFVYKSPRFSAVIAPDGHVKFVDLVAGAAVCVGGQIEAGRCGDAPLPTLFEALGSLARGGGSRPPPPLLFVPEPAFPLTARLVWVRGAITRSDSMHKLTGSAEKRRNDWRAAHRYEKEKFLAATFEFRVEMAADWHRKLLREALADLPSRLEELWQTPQYTPAEKRMTICRLWAEVDFADEQARAAADVIEAWIRRRLPAGTTHAYRARELHECRRDPQPGAAPALRRFDPYAAPETEGARPLPRAD